jgi:hypothetical protein
VPRQDSNLRHRLLKFKILARARVFPIYSFEQQDWLQWQLDHSRPVALHLAITDEYVMGKTWSSPRLFGS